MPRMKGACDALNGAMRRKMKKGHEKAAPKGTVQSVAQTNFGPPGSYGTLYSSLKLILDLFQVVSQGPHFF